MIVDLNFIVYSIASYYAATRKDQLLLLYDRSIGIGIRRNHLLLLYERPLLLMQEVIDVEAIECDWRKYLGVAVAVKCALLSVHRIEHPRSDNCEQGWRALPTNSSGHADRAERQIGSGAIGGKATDVRAGRYYTGNGPVHRSHTKNEH